MITRQRSRLRAPDGLDDHVSRIEAARLLGYPSSFKVRQLEMQGRLPAVRGRLGSAWYARSDILALRASPVAPVAVPPSREARAPAVAPASPGARGRRRTDPELITYLRDFGARSPATARGPTVADLVADMGVSIARAQKVFRFWLTHDGHPAAGQVRAHRGVGRPSEVPLAEGPAPSLAAPAERRSAARLGRAGLIRQLRSPDPAVRAAAFEGLKTKSPPADG